MNTQNPEFSRKFAEAHQKCAEAYAKLAEAQCTNDDILLNRRLFVVMECLGVISDLERQFDRDKLT